MSDELYNDFIKWFTDNRNNFVNFKVLKEISKDEKSVSFTITTNLPFSKSELLFNDIVKKIPRECGCIGEKKC